MKAEKHWGDVAIGSILCGVRPELAISKDGRIKRNNYTFKLEMVTCEACLALLDSKPAAMAGEGGK